MSSTGQVSYYLGRLGALSGGPQLKPETLRRFRNRCVQRLVVHAYTNVRYYRQLFDQHGIDPHRIRCVDDLQQIPITSRRDLQAQDARDIVARDLDPDALLALTTAGSSGRPFTIRRTWFEQNWLHTFRLRAHSYFGLRTRDRALRISSLRPVDSRDNKTIGRALHRLGIYRFAQVGTHLPLDEILTAFRAYRPDVLFGNPGFLSYLAGGVGDLDTLATFPRLVITGAEVMTPHQRTQISRGFRAPVFDLYGCSEFNIVAWECRQTGHMHVCDDSVIVEILKNASPVLSGEQGQVVATGLHSYAMPLIRYRVDDVATKGHLRCPCGQPYSTLHSIQGRVVEYFRLPSGRLIHPFDIMETMRRHAHKWMAHVQLIQEQKDLIVMYVVPFDRPQPGCLTDISASVNALLERDVRFEIQFVREIAPDFNGKHRVFKSRVVSADDPVRQDEIHDRPS